MLLEVPIHLGAWHVGVGVAGVGVPTTGANEGCIHIAMHLTIHTHAASHACSSPITHPARAQNIPMHSAAKKIVAAGLRNGAMCGCSSGAGSSTIHGRSSTAPATFTKEDSASSAVIMTQGSACTSATTRCAPAVSFRRQQSVRPHPLND